LWKVAVPKLCAITNTPIAASMVLSSPDELLRYAQKAEGSIYAQTGVFTVQGATVYENGIVLPTVVRPGDSRLLNTAIAENRLEWQGRESLFENGQWVTRNQGADRILYTSRSLSDTWLWLNNWL
ncbi:MAG: hypothetical protein H0U76_11910, partial [Ktedonobacteraceae bacterium]|nr:hypothetical protein [Ktedonobacteraceae bacterium]